LINSLHRPKQIWPIPQAALTLAKATASRWKALPADATSPQEVDEKNSALAAQLAQLKSAQANVDRLQTLQKFKYITAPLMAL